MSLKLKEIRISKGLTIPALSRLADVPKRTIEDLEAKGDGRLSTAHKLAKALNITLDELYTE